MPKKETSKLENTHTQIHSSTHPEPEVQGKSKHKKAYADSVAAETKVSSKEIYHSNERYTKEKPISPVYPMIDNDLARDNIENDITSADLQDI